MTRKKVFVDFDNVVYDLEKKNCKSVKEIYGVNINAMDVVHWNFYQENFPEIVHIWGDWNQYKDSSFFDGDVEFIQALQAKYDVSIVTASYPTIEEQKDRMIYHRYGDIRVIHTKLKHPHTVDGILIDDAIHNILGHVENNNMPAIIVDRGYGWNQGFEHELVVRAQSFKSILTALKNM